MQSQIQTMLGKGMIRKVILLVLHQPFLSRRKMLMENPSIDFVLTLEPIIRWQFDCYPLPNFEETVSTLHGSKYFTVLDFSSGFWQLHTAESHKGRTAFSVPSGHYEFQRLPFGLANSPANFQRLLGTVLSDLIGPECWAFIDDIIIFPAQ